MDHPAYGAGPDDRGPEPGGWPVPTGDLPPRPPSPGTRLGRAQGVELRRESRSGENVRSELTVLAFRVLEPGSPRPLDVLMRGRSLSGTVRDGDWVELPASPNEAGRWNLSKIENLTTGATVLVLGGRPNKAATVVAVVVLALVVIVALVVMGAIISTLANA